MLGGSGRIGVRVGQAVIHRTHARGIGVAQPGDLNWRGFAREDQQTIARHVAGEIHEDVHLILPNEIGDLQIRHARDVAPLVRVLPETGGERVRSKHIRVTEDLDSIAVVAREQSIPVAMPPPDTSTRRVSELSSAALFGSAVASERSELQMRGSWPLMTLVLAVCAVPLSRQRPRQGRFSRIWIAVLFFALYAGLLQVASLWLERGATPGWLGLWWVHGLFAGAGWLLAQAARPRRRRVAV